MKICQRYVVSGRVQGVFFRQGTLEKASELNLTGWVRNLDNGDVECFACGEPKAIASLARWLEKGPPAAKVSSLKVFDVPVEEHTIFKIQR